MTEEWFVTKEDDVITSDDKMWMRLALEQARQAAVLDEVPVGAIAVYRGQVIGQGYNSKESVGLKNENFIKNQIEAQVK